MLNSLWDFSTKALTGLHVPSLSTRRQKCMKGAVYFTLHVKLFGFKGKSTAFWESFEFLQLCDTHCSDKMSLETSVLIHQTLYRVLLKCIRNSISHDFWQSALSHKCFMFPHSRPIVVSHLCDKKLYPTLSVWVGGVTHTLACWMSRKSHDNILLGIWHRHIWLTSFRLDILWPYNTTIILIQIGMDL